MPTVAPHSPPPTHRAELVAVQQNPRQLLQRLLHPSHDLHGRQPLTAVELHRLGDHLAGLQHEVTRSQRRRVPARRHHGIQQLAHGVHQDRAGVSVAAEPQGLQASLVGSDSVQDAQRAEELHVGERGDLHRTPVRDGGHRRLLGYGGRQEIRSL